MVLIEYNLEPFFDCGDSLASPRRRKGRSGHGAMICLFCVSLTFDLKLAACVFQLFLVFLGGLEAMEVSPRFTH